MQIEIVHARFVSLEGLMSFFSVNLAHFNAVVVTRVAVALVGVSVLNFSAGAQNLLAMQGDVSTSFFLVTMFEIQWQVAFLTVVCRGIRLITPDDMVRGLESCRCRRQRLCLSLQKATIASV